MKKLIFIRHGRAEEPGPEITDFVRSLTVKGKNISRLMARELLKIESPSLVMITSPAFRALETALIFAEEFGIPPEKLIINSTLYYKMNFQYLVDIISNVSEETDSVALFGHNPSFTEISDRLCKEGCGFLPKCGIAGISFKVKRWQDITYNTGKLEYFLKPE
jgi:phosphohistidine phosphatase